MSGPSRGFAYLRHSCATLLFTMGVQPATVQRILRHSSIFVTAGTYVEVIEAVQRDALDTMHSLIGSASSGRSECVRQRARRASAASRQPTRAGSTATPQDPRPMQPPDPMPPRYRT